MKNKVCTGKTAKDCFECKKYYASHSSHFDTYYNCNIIEITCNVGGYRIFKDEDMI